MVYAQRLMMPARVADVMAMAAPARGDLMEAVRPRRQGPDGIVLVVSAG